jgi:Suppressor of fused protein (SUFU)
MSIASNLLDHYEKYLGTMKENYVFLDSVTQTSIQVLRFDNVFADCVTYASVGCTHFNQELHGDAEIVLVCDKDHSLLPSLLANTIFFAADRQLNVHTGFVLGNLGVIVPKSPFSGRAIYITDAMPFPSPFRCFSSEGRHIVMKLAVFIYRDELQFIEKYGRDAFESLLEEKEIDPFSFDRVAATHHLNNGT